MIDYSLYLVTDPNYPGGRDKVIDVVLQAVAGGVTVVQLRDKTAPDGIIEAQARELLDKLPSNVPLFINDRVEVAARIGAHVHVGQSDMEFTKVRELIGPDALVGVSCSNHAEMDAFSADQRPDVLGIGPVFATPTKTDTEPALGYELTAELAARGHDLGIASVAIGGVHKSNAADVIATGVDGLCVVSEIMAADDPKRAAYELREAMGK